MSLEKERELYVLELGGFGVIDAVFNDINECIDFYCFDFCGLTKDDITFGYRIWQASANREGHKLVPVDDINIMDIIYGKCPCGSSRAPIISDKEGYNLIHCFSCCANKYIHEDY